MKISDELKTARKRAHLTQEQLAELLQTKRINITKWESGATPLGPNLEKVLDFILKHS